MENLRSSQKCRGIYLVAAPKNAERVGLWIRPVLQILQSDFVCPLLAQSGHAGRDNECLVLGVKRTFVPIAYARFCTARGK